MHATGNAFQVLTAKPLDASTILHGGRSITMLDGQLMDAFAQESGDDDE